MGQAFDASKSGDYFYLPPEAFHNPDFQRGLKLFLSPDGKAARFIITHDADPATRQAFPRSCRTRRRTSSGQGHRPHRRRFYLAGTAAIYRDIQSGANYDLLIVGIAALTLIFAVMVIITRALVASLVIVGTVLLSLGAAFGLVRTGVATPGRPRIELDRAGLRLDHPAGRRLRLQPAACLAVQGGDRRGTKDRHHPLHGRNRRRRHRGGPGIRLHHDVHGGQ